MKRYLLFIASIFLLAGCRQFDALPYTPAQTPETWLRIQPFAEIQIGTRAIILVQPTTSAIVYLLGVLTIGVGLYFLRIRGNERSRLWWGIALLLWGIGALLAGTSYEAFSYQIKCAGREWCIWTSWWEIAYLFVSAASLDAMMVAQAYCCAAGKLRRGMILYAMLNIVLYALALLIGSVIPLRFLISFELLLLAVAPNVAFFFVLNSWRYRKLKQDKDRVLLFTWAWLTLTIAAYFIYFALGMTNALWARGIWFSENDVLHIGLIIWMLYIARIAANQISDATSPEY